MSKSVGRDMRRPAGLERAIDDMNAFLHKLIPIRSPKYNRCCAVLDSVDAQQQRINDRLLEQAQAAARLREECLGVKTALEQSGVEAASSVGTVPEAPRASARSSQLSKRLKAQPGTSQSPTPKSSTASVRLNRNKLI